MKKFPKEVYVQKIDDGTDEYLSVSESLDVLEKEEVVAVYVLKETKKFKITRELV